MSNKNQDQAVQEAFLAAQARRILKKIKKNPYERNDEDLMLSLGLSIKSIKQIFEQHQVTVVEGKYVIGIEPA